MLILQQKFKRQLLTPSRRIEQWHNYGGVTAQYLLKAYKFGYYDETFNRRKIGYDAEGHAATFAVDDSTVYKIPFDSSNAAPLDDLQAEKVLKKLNLLKSGDRN